MRQDHSTNPDSGTLASACLQSLLAGAVSDSLSAASELSRHARKRMKQRAIPIEAVDALLTYGQATRCGGADRIVFRRATARKAKQMPTKLERWRGIYAVVADDGQIVTVGHRTRRFHRN